MIPPTLAQQRAMAFAPIPFATLSFFSSSYVIYFILWTERQKLKRLYHRLVLAMNFALLPLSFTWVWGPFAVPEGTLYYPAASGTIQTCTVSAFLYMMFSLTVPTYYASLSLQAFLGIRNNFKETKYIWIEKWVHIVAYCIPCTIAILLAATENFNPNGGGCYVAKAPRGCEADPDVPCQRGKDIHMIEYIIGFGLIFLYLIFPPSVVISMYCWIGREEKMMETSTGMHRLRQSARKQMMQSVGKQICVYLISFWFTWVFALIHTAFEIFTGELNYGLLILSNCLFASQGIVFAGVYFSLQRFGKPKIDCVSQNSMPIQRRCHLTVLDIRQNAESSNGLECTETRRESCMFNVFDGEPDEDSPWAKFFQDEDEESPNNVEETIAKIEHEDAD